MNSQEMMRGDTYEAESLAPDCDCKPEDGDDGVALCESLAEPESAELSSGEEEADDPDVPLPASESPVSAFVELLSEFCLLERRCGAGV